MILMFFLILMTHLRHFLDLLDGKIHLNYHQDCPQLFHLLVGIETQELKMYRVSDRDHDLNHRSHNWNQFKWVTMMMMIVMMMVISHHKMGDNGNGPYRVIEYILTH